MALVTVTKRDQTIVLEKKSKLLWTPNYVPWLKDTVGSLLNTACSSREIKKDFPGLGKLTWRLPTIEEYKRFMETSEEYEPIDLLSSTQTRDGGKVSYLNVESLDTWVVGRSEPVYDLDFPLGPRLRLTYKCVAEVP